MPRGFKYLTIDQIEEICHILARSLFDTPESPMGKFKYINKGIMESAIQATQLYYYPTLFEKAATLGFQIMKGHALLDGNKRIGITTTMVFLNINGYIINAPNKEVLVVALKVVTNKYSKKDFQKWLEENSKKV